MRRSRLISTFAVLVATGLVVTSCSREDSGNSSAPAQPPRGAAQDPGGGANSGATDPQMQVAPMKFEKPAITDIREILNSTNQAGLWTRTVDLSGVTVQRRLGDFMLVGPDKDNVVPVQFGGQQPEVKPGQKVDVGGIIDPLGSDKSQWNGNPAVQKDLGRYSVFISATSVKAAEGK